MVGRVVVEAGRGSGDGGCVCTAVGGAEGHGTFMDPTGSIEGRTEGGRDSGRRVR